MRRAAAAAELSAHGGAGLHAQGYARQLLKDLEMVSAFAGALKAPTPMSGEALNLYRLLSHLGGGELDTTAIVKVYDRHAAANEGR